MAISPAVIAAGVGAAGSIGGGLLGMMGTENAAQTSANTQMSIFDQTQKNLAPFIQMGGGAFSQLSGLLGFGPGGFNKSSAANAMNTLQNMPGYQFQMKQGMQATDAAAAARGLNLSGGQIKDEQSFAQGTAQNAWNSYIGQLTQASGIGESAAAGQGQIGAQTGASVGQNQFYGGLAGTGYLTSGLSGALNNSSLGYLLSQQPQGGAAPGQDEYSQLLAGENSDGFYGTASDIRLKTDIRRVGKTDEGIGVYLYRYKGVPGTRMGVMAQEVERTRPDAVRTMPSGYKAVDYSKLRSPLGDLLKEAA